MRPCRPGFLLLPPYSRLQTILTGMAAILAVFVLAACRQEQPAPISLPPVPVGVVEITPRPFVFSTSLVGRIEASEKVEIVARIVGELQERTFTEGQEVQAGDLLFRIEKAPFTAVVEQRKAELAAAAASLTAKSLQLSRARELAQSRTIPQAQLDERIADHAIAEASRMKAAAALRAAEIDLGYTDIYAPLTGRTGRTAVSTGNVVGPQTGSLVRIVRQDPMNVLFSISQRDFMHIRRGTGKEVLLRLRFADGSAYPLTGTIDFVDSVVKSGTDSVTIRGTIANPEHTLLDGQLVTVVVESATPVATLLMPQTALMTDQQGSYVYVVDTDNTARIRRIVTAPGIGAEVVITSGLIAGERVIVEGLQKIRPGQTVHTAPGTKPHTEGL